MTLELKRRNNGNPHKLSGVRGVTDKTGYGKGTFEITIFDTRIFATEDFEYVKDADTERYFIKDGAWIYNG